MMPKEKTVVIIKPEGKRVGMTDKFGDESFEEGNLFRQITCGEVDIFFIEGDDVVLTVRSDKVIGQTHLNTGLRGWIRTTYYSDESFWRSIQDSTGDDPHGKEYRYNGIHAPSSIEEAERDWNYFNAKVLSCE
jgi:nucleoside diphosphate kinase